MRKIAVPVVALAIVVVFASCAVLPMRSKLNKPVSMTQMKDGPGEHFSEEKQAFWLFWGLAPLIIPEIDEVVASEVSGHAGVQNLKITTQYTAIDMIINILTSGILHPRTITIEGEVYD